ncbi:MAG TPA: nucleoside-diphosphate sugar epimerase/dehydratase [Anaerolineales bacterium]|nr:nucleoside-diphosphate sugar epimerase/dehydratase [Anaerolineales bacterium]
MDAIATRPHVRNRYVFYGDLALILVSVLGSFALRLDVGQLPYYFPATLTMCVVALAVKVPTYYFFGLYRRLWIYASVHELRLITAAVTTASVIMSAVMLALISVGWVVPGMPRSALGIDWLLSLVLIGGARFALRILAEQGAPPRVGSRRRALVVGAGDAGALVVRELQRSAQLNLTPVGLLDDDPAKQNQEIHGVPVIGFVKDLAAVLDTRPVDEVVFAIPSAPGRVVRMVNDACRIKGIPSRTMPGIYELIGGRVSVNRLREVDITDLLRREPTQVNAALIGGVLSQKSVLVTGAGGSIGQELCRQIARWNPSQLTMLGHGENSIFEAVLDLRDSFPGLSVAPVISDVKDSARIRQIFGSHQVEVIFHAAAHKHVPLMQMNVAEAVLNNVFGTLSVVEAALAVRAERLVLISTDKAVRPANVYGATKRLAELIVLDAARRSGAAFSVVRFGNVLGSRGSVIPLFKRQIAAGGPVLVTHPDMERYFMTIPEAVNLVLQAAAMGRGAEAFLLEMGQQVRILDLAEDLIRLTGLEPGRDVEIDFTGIRPGEKLREELWELDRIYERTEHPDIVRSANEVTLADGDLQTALEALQTQILAGDTAGVVETLQAAIPGAAISEAPAPDITAIV